MPFFSKRVIHSSVFAKERSAVLSFELETVDINHTIACLQFDHAQRFESTTDRFTLQLYGEFNWKYGKIGLLCSLCPQGFLTAMREVRITSTCVLSYFTPNYRMKLHSASRKNVRSLFTIGFCRSSMNRIL